MPLPHKSDGSHHHKSEVKIELVAQALINIYEFTYEDSPYDCDYGIMFYQNRTKDSSDFISDIINYPNKVEGWSAFNTNV